MRVVFFTESLYPHVDGVSRTLARLFETLECRGVEFQVFSPFVPGAEASWSGRVHPVRFVRFPPYPQYRVSLPATRRVRRVASAFAPDLIHVVSPTPMGFAAQRLARQLGIPVVASFHTHFVSYFRYSGVRRLEGFGWSLLRSFYRGCSRVYAPSQSSVGELRTRGVGGVELWSRGVDLDAFSPAHRDPDLFSSSGGRGPATEASRPVLLMVSRLVKEKDLADLIEVDRILRSRGVRYTFALVGDGPLRGELEAALPSAIFLGQRGGTDLARCYASADLFVFPSTTETFGNVVLEALASGLPCVVSDRGGPRDLITEGVNGFIARANDAVSIADRLQPLLEDAELRARFSRAARDSALRRDWATINGALISSYAHVVEEARSVSGSI